MKKNKFIYSFSAITLACIISFSGLGSTYIQAHATSVGIERPVWNDEESVWDNILMHLRLYMSFSGVFTNPSTILFNAQDFYDFMISDGVSHDTAHGVFCDCDVATHTSFDGQEHGGGGYVRDGISMDDDGNVTYSDEVSDLFHGFILDYLDTNSGYVLYKTLKASVIGVNFFSNQTQYENFVSTIDNLGLVYCNYYNSSTPYVNLGYVPMDSLFCLKNPSEWFWYKNSSTNEYLGYNYSSSYVGTIEFRVLYEDWNYDYPQEILLNNSKKISFDVSSYSLSDFTISTTDMGGGAHYFILNNDGTFNSYYSFISNDGRNVKVWYDLEKFKNYDIGNQMYYVTDSFNSYDSSIDNSTTITSQEYAYYNDNSTTIYQTIQNNIDNSGNSDLTEKDVQDIVDAAVQEIKDSIANSGNDDNGGSDSGDSDGGSGVGDLVDGIGKLLDTILSLIGKVMGVVADFTHSILDLFSGFTEFTDGFSNFLSGAFGFIPQEIWNVIQVGLSLMILLAVIKFLRK